MTNPARHSRILLAAGDLLALAVVTYLGFASHGEAKMSSLPRMAAAFFPLVFGWFLLAGAMDLFSRNFAAASKSLWRPPLAMIFSASFAVLLRGLILNSPVIPIFGVVFSTVSAAGILVWRSVYFLIIR